MAERAVAAVLGLDVLGISLAQALRQSGRYGTVVAWDPDFDTARAAQRLKPADRFPRSAPEAVRNAAVVFVVVRASQVYDTLAAIGSHLRPGAVVVILTEVHEWAAEQAAQALPGSVSVLLAYPFLWETVEAETEPSPALLRDGVLCVTPAMAAHPDAVAYLADLAAALGMTTRFLDAREHDAFLSGVSHLPALLAAALLRVLSRQVSWREISRLAGGDLRQATAPAGAEPARRQDALAAGRDHLIRWLDEMVAELLSLRRSLEDGREPGDLYEAAAEVRRRWLVDRQRAPEAAAAEGLPGGELPRRRFWF